MNTLQTWALAWGVPEMALADLRTRLTSSAPAPAGAVGESSETALGNQVRMNAARKGTLLFRNNVGAGKLENGSFIRWGLCNDSKALNQQIKSSDLIGVSPVVITPAHVGHTVGVFLGREVKAPGWKYRATAHEKAQLRFIEIIQGLGGDARFTCSPEGDL